jgi:2-octaprenyl-6-methoxyphenol hydroxylase
MAPARASGVETAADTVGVRVVYEGEETIIRTRLLISADGARSPLRAALGIGTRTRDYGQAAIVGTVSASLPGAHARAFERFTADGPLALLPAGDGRYVYVLTRSTEDAPRTLALADGEFCDLLQTALGMRLGRFTSLGRRSAYPLELVVADRVTAHRAVLVGNAAHSLHPVAGQGYNLALRDVAALAELVAGAPGDPGGEAVLAAYSSWRAPDQRRVVAFTDGLVRGFGLPALGAVRGTALQLFDLVPRAKPLFTRQTMGLFGRRSRLARGLAL